MKTIDPTLNVAGGYWQPTPIIRHAHPFLGKSKWQIEQDLCRLNCQITQFAHWLYILELGLVLSFDNQMCVKIGDYQNH